MFENLLKTKLLITPSSNLCKSYLVPLLNFFPTDSIFNHAAQSKCADSVMFLNSVGQCVVADVTT